MFSILVYLKDSSLLHICRCTIPGDLEAISLEISESYKEASWSNRPMIFIHESEESSLIVFPDQIQSLAVVFKSEEDEEGELHA